MFKVKYKNAIFTVYSISDDSYVLIYMNNRWKWVSMGATEPILNL